MMTVRMNHRKENPNAFQALLGLEKMMEESSLDKGLYELIKLRASQINGCSFCIDMHAKDLLDQGEDLDRILQLPVWREVPFFSDKERAVLAFTEAVTNISQGGVPDDIYAKVKEHFNEREIVELIMAINTINCWNRLAITTGMYPGCFD
jgi:AhpD family alkylhydroperoxidase